ncbi:hypothetical protein [Salicola sp. Rm-C-2C1-2]|uniref:hypothetical protein n=1 Tax=Salicola sp. Rm-C-2C1-2 TaxID=3141321 RepID=UPI0032E50D10
MEHSSEYGPTRDATGDRVGIVSYLNEGLWPIPGWRRENAYELMHNRCSGDYTLLDEDTSTSEPTYYTQASSGTATTYGFTSEYVYFTFRCN